MQEVTIVPSMLKEISADIPDTLEGALDPGWLSNALGHLSGGAAIRTVELSEVIKAMAAKVRIAVTFENAPDKVYHLCIKGFLDHDLGAGAGGLTTLRESSFYAEIAPHTGMCTPPCAAVVTDRKNSRAILVMADMIATGTHFYNALEPLTVDQAAQTLEQLARLHAHPELLEGRNWVPCRLDEIVHGQPFITWEQIQALMHDERRGNLPDPIVDASLLKGAMEALAAWGQSVPHTILHGDSHPGNVYRTREGEMGFTDWQLVQRGHWSLDVAYHIASVLPVEVAEREERHLLDHYLQAVQGHGGPATNREDAWRDYRRAPVYGYYHWAITRRVHPPITHQAFGRLGAAVDRHDSFGLLGLR